MRNNFRCFSFIIDLYPPAATMVCGRVFSVYDKSVCCFNFSSTHANRMSYRLLGNRKTRKGEAKRERREKKKREDC